MAVEILFDRSVGYYFFQVWQTIVVECVKWLDHFLQIYAPATFIVVVSWLSFWLSGDDRVDRLSLGVTTVLTITLFMASVNATLPKISYIKAVDLYLLVCFAFVFMALLGTQRAFILHQRLMIGLFICRVCCVELHLQPGVPPHQGQDQRGRRCTEAEEDRSSPLAGHVKIQAFMHISFFNRGKLTLFS